VRIYKPRSGHIELLRGNGKVGWLRRTMRR
jgi:hypothetical protein